MYYFGGKSPAKIHIYITNSQLTVMKMQDVLFFFFTKTPKMSQTS